MVLLYYVVKIHLLHLKIKRRALTLWAGRYLLPLGYLLGIELNNKGSGNDYVIYHRKGKRMGTIFLPLPNCAEKQSQQLFHKGTEGEIGYT